MKQRNSGRQRLAVLSGLAAIGFTAATVFACPAQVSVTRGRGNGSARQGRPGAVLKHDSSAQNRDVHARRETVRTREPIPMPQRHVTTPQRPITLPRNTGQRSDRRPTLSGSDRTARTPQARGVPGVLAHRIFTRTQEGRHYDNGIRLRKGAPVQAAWQRRYFPRGHFHYPYYSPSYGSASIVISPFGFYFGICAPFIWRNHCHYVPPAVVYVDIPLYINAIGRGYAPIRRDENYLDRDYLLQREPGLASAVDELREAFRTGDIDALVALTDPRVKIAVFLQGKYEYSLAPGDYLDLARDAFQATETIAFDLTRIHERAAGVYVVSGEHVYRDRENDTRKVYVSYVLEDIGGVWTLTQVGTAPDRIEEWKGV